ncbi:palmitoyltransferase ZDHHC15B-like [Dermacentor variabilis]|uniref:palmitoyltransferase ZDHHC15B-like n=1 Tax=Dermacentor variabilis TaxID=34621 RepID=UPI003F5C6B2A
MALLGSDGSGETGDLPPAFPRKPRNASGRNPCVTATGHCIAALVRLLRALLCPIVGCHKRFRGAFALLRLMPIVVEFIVLGWEYHTYVLVMCRHLLADSGLAYRLSRLLGFHVTLFGALWPFERLLRTPLKPVPVCFYVMQRMDSDDRRRRYCYRCHVIKPDRCHHCQMCGTCVLKMDHHCPWFNTCVSFSNYKYFILFLFYSFVHCAFVSWTTFPHFGITPRLVLGFWPELNITFLFLLSLFFGLAFVGLLLYHLFLLCFNCTTLEMIARQGFRRYDVGVCRNIAQVMGPRKLLWLVPVYTSLGDGAVFPLRSDVAKNAWAV